MRLSDRPAASTVATLLAATLAVVLWCAASAQAHGLRRLTPGVRAAAPTAQGLSRTLGQATGLTPSQVVAKNICPPAAAGYARCSAQVLVLRSDGALVRPRHGAHASLGQVRPAVRSGSASPGAANPATGGSSPPQADTPAYLQQAYDLAYLSQTAGSNDTVAIIDAYYDPTAASDLTTYRSNYALPACTTGNGCFQQVNENGATSPLPSTRNSGWEEETSLDLDAVSAVCPNCKILLVEANSANSNDLDTAMRAAARMGANQISDSWTITSSQIPGGTYTFSGVATVAATGDNGYVGTAADNYPAAFPGVTAAGGTSLGPANGGTNPRGFTESAWSLSGGEGGGSGCDLHFNRPSYQPNAGCNGRAYADLSADADPNTGLIVYDSGNGSGNDHWALVGGTSLATPLIAAYYAVTGATATTPQWAYTDSGLMNDIVSGSNGSCNNNILYICNAGVGYDGPSGVGSISGAVTTGAPGIGGPAFVSNSSNTYTESVAPHGATIAGGIYRNGLDTTWSIQYGPANNYPADSRAATPVDIGSGTSPVDVTGYLSQLTPGTQYDYQIVAQNSLGTTSGYTYSFTTTAESPTYPTASFAASPTAPTPGSAVSFNASGATPGTGGTIRQYSWNFGDGSSIENDSTPTTSHTYAARGTYTVTLTVTNNAGNDTTSQTVTVDNPPTAAFTPSATLTTPGSPVSFDGAASAPGSGSTITDYSWNFGDGTTQDTDTTPTGSHTYSAPGNYTATLTVTDDLNVSNSVSVQIVADQPTASFASSPPNPTPNSTVTFDGSSSTDAPVGTITDYKWSFGDGSPVDDTSTTPTASHPFARGTYDVTLTVTDSHGQTASQSETLVVDNPPTAAFTPSPTPTTPGTAMSFDGTASAPGAGGTISDYSWNFGDGTMLDTGTTPTASHTYDAPGRYTVVLTVTDDLDVTNSTSQQVVVDQPNASFTATPTVFAPGGSSTFDASGSTDPEGTITDYSWSFGDGDTENTSTTPSVSHPFAARGSYVVTLTVTNNYGQASASTQTVTVDTPPTAAFTSSPTPSTPGSAVSLNGTGSSSSGNINNYSWTFGDGTTASGATPSHAYSAPGDFTVSLTVTDDLGATNTTSHELTVDAPPAASFTASPNPASPVSPVSFNASSSGDPDGMITGYSWNFGDGAAGSGVNPSHAYAASGIYSVTLTVSNDAGQTSSFTRAVTVTAVGVPVASFTASPNPATVGSAVSFAGGASIDPGGTITGYSWNFGDGGTGGGVNATHAYAAPGTYTVTLTVTASSGKPASTSSTVTIDPQPLSGRLAAPKQKLAALVKRGLQLNVAVNQNSTVSFQVTIPGAIKHAGKASPRHAPAITLLSVHGRSVAAGTHQISLKLSKAGARALPRTGPVVLTVRITVTDAYGRTITRTAKVAVQR